MNTDDLIGALKADNARRSLSLPAVWWSASIAASILAAIAFFALIGPRPDIAAAAHTPRFLFKFVVTLALVAAALPVVVRLSRPGERVAGRTGLLLPAPVLLVAAAGLEFLSVPSGLWGERWIGSNIAVCLTFIPAIGIMPLAVFLAALRHSAPTMPGLAGAVSGLLAGGVAATFYAAHCTDDSPFFVATWYPVAIALLAAAGFIVGRSFARW